MHNFAPTSDHRESTTDRHRGFWLRVLFHVVASVSHPERIEVQYQFASLLSPLMCQKYGAKKMRKKQSFELNLLIHTH